MKSTILLILAIIFSTNYCYSQDNPNKTGYLSISGGASFPTGGFADDKSFAPAKTGYNFSIAYNKTEWSNFGFSGMLYGQIIPVNTEKIAEIYNTATASVKSKDWIIGGALFGGYGYIPIENRPFAIELKLLIGGVYTKFPDLEVTGVFNQTNTIAYSFAYLIGAGFNFRASDGICLLADLNYSGSSPEIETISAGFATINTTKTSQSIGTININFGIGFIF